MSLSLIAAMASNRVIGVDNRLPWRLPEDLARFKALTLGHALVVGRRTFESIGRPLPGRRMIVLSRQPDFAPAGVQVVRSLEEALEAAGEGEVFVGGGSELYAMALGRADRVYLTLIEHPFPGDTFFPKLDPASWVLTSDEPHPPGPAFPHPFRFQVLDRARG